MQTRPPRKTGVLGVLGVPQRLQVSSDGTYSHGTQLRGRWNTRCSEHRWCSKWLAARAKHFRLAGYSTCGEADAVRYQSCYALVAIASSALQGTTVHCGAMGGAVNGAGGMHER